MVLGMLRQLKAAKPKTVKKLTGTIAARFQKKLSDTEISGLINELLTKGYVTVSGTKVNYAV
jgi:predicted transcriptional regulator